ncbi:MAG: hypothetical protein Q7Q71_14020 [Verrucomicrobiota bacterium JB023]|nr:hypothetical protein [Verrucomicrobiota bacterium JB023]
MKRILQVGIPVVSIAFIALGFVTCSVIGKIGDHYREPHLKGIEYMSNLDADEIVTIIDFSNQLMALAPNSIDWINMGPYSDQEIPERWSALGVQGIRYDASRVTFYFAGGGPAARTLMQVYKDSSGNIVITATHWDVEQSPPLYTSKRSEQGGHAKTGPQG